MDPVVARKMWRTLEPYHGMIYFTPRATEAYARAGHHRPSRLLRLAGGADGRRAAEVVVATFFNFHPELVRRAHPRRVGGRPRRPPWSRPASTPPTGAVASCSATRSTGSAEMRSAADLARRAAEALHGRGPPALRRPRGARLARRHPTWCCGTP